MRAPLLHLKLMKQNIFTTNWADKNNLTPIISHHPFFESLRFRIHLEATLARLLARQGYLLSKLCMSCDLGL